MRAYIQNTITDVGRAPARLFVFPNNCPFTPGIIRGSGSHLIDASLGPPRVHNPNCIWSGSAIFAQIRAVSLQFITGGGSSLPP